LIFKSFETGSVKSGAKVNELLMNPRKNTWVQFYGETQCKTLDTLAHVDINKADGGVDVTEIVQSAGIG
jgi:hypothetical protein